MLTPRLPEGIHNAVSNELLNRVWSTASGLTAAQKLIWAYLADRANQKGICWPSLEDIQTSTEVSRAGVFGALAELQRRGLVEKRNEGKRLLFALALSPDSVVSSLNSGLPSPNSGLPQSKIKTVESKSWTPEVQILDSASPNSGLLYIGRTKIGRAHV